MAKTVIQSKQLSKVYGSQKALDEVSIQVKQGDIYGLIGRNGAGKTTLLKILTRQIHPSQGTVKVFSESLDQTSRKNLRIGSIIEAPGIFSDLTAYDNMLLKCEAMGIRRKNYIEDILDLVELKEIMKTKRTKHYSLGMKQRLGLALALVGDPDILLLDEPTNGMDPQGISAFRELIVRLNQERHITIIISSHILAELSKFINKVGILHEGRLLVEASTEKILEENRDKLILTSQNLPKITAFLEEKLEIFDYKVVSKEEIHIYESIQEPERISHALIEANILFDTFSLHEDSLEAYYMQLTGGGRHA